MELCWENHGKSTQQMEAFGHFSSVNHGFYDHLLDWILIGDLSFLDDIIGVYTTGFSRLSPGGWIAASGWSKTISKMWRSSGHHI